MVDHLDPTPLPRQLASILRAAIEEGEYQRGDPLPSESTLVQEHGVSRGVVRQAMEILRYEGLVVTIQGRRSYVARTR